MKSVIINNKTYEINTESVNAGRYSFVIEDGLYDLNTINTLEKEGIECHIDKAEGNELVCRCDTPIEVVDIVETLEDLADLINNSDEWPMAANKAIRDNGWVDDTDTDSGICHTSSHKVVFNDNGVAVVLQNEDSVVSTLRRMRISAGLSQQYVADKIGVAQQQVARIESGKHSPSLDIVERYAEAIGHKIVVE